MGREAALSARLTLDDSDLQKKIARQPANYSTLLSHNKKYQEKLAAENRESYNRQIAEDRRFAEKIIAERQKMSARASAATFKKGGSVISRDALEGAVKEEMVMAAAKRTNAQLERRLVLEQKLAENRERYLDRERRGTVTLGPDPRPLDIQRRSLSGSDWSHLEGRGDVFRPRTATGNVLGGKQNPGRGATNAGMGLLMLSQTLDDLQYGFKGIVNNIAPLIMSMGGSTGLAGAATIAAVGINVLTKALGDEESRIRETNRQLEQYQEIQSIINRGVKEAEARGTATGNGAANAVANSTRARSEFDQMLAREREVANLRKEAALASTENLPAPERARAQAAINAREEAAALAESREHVERRLNLDRASAAAANERLATAREELETLRAQRDAAESEKEQEISAMEAALSLQKAQRAINPLKAGVDAALNVAGAITGAGDVNPFKAEEAAIEARRKMGSNFPAGKQMKLAELEASLAGLEEAAGALNQRIKEGENATVDLNLAEAKMAQQRAKEAREIEQIQQEQARGKALDFWRIINSAVDSTSDKLRGLINSIAGDTRGDARNNTREVLAIAEERRKGNFRRAERMQRALDVRTRAADLEKAQGFSPADAADIAGREYDAAHPDNRIRNTLRSTRATGLVDLQSTSRLMPGGAADPFGLREAAHHRAAREQSHLAVVRAGAENTGGQKEGNTLSAQLGLLRTVVTELQKIAANTAGTAADNTAPARKTDS